LIFLKLIKRALPMEISELFCCLLQFNFIPTSQ
jgi:hypothetical protein